MTAQRTFGILIALITTLLANNANLNTLTFIRAKTRYPYVKSITNGTTATDIATDEFLMVALRNGFAVGPAQIRFRLIGPPIEQISYVKEINYSVVKYTHFKLKDNEIEEYSPNYGFLTLVSNVFVKKFSSISLLGRPARIRRHYRTHVGQKLLAVGPNMNTVFVAVVPFADCKAIFDPKGVFLVDSEEQFCTTMVPMTSHSGDEAFSTPTALLFDARRNDVFVGITSKSKNGYTLSSLISVHCDFLEGATKTPVCD